MAKVFFYICLLLAESAAFAQQPRGIAVSSMVDTADRRPLSIAEPVKCDSDGRIYAQFRVSRSEPAITSISEDGKRVSIINLNTAPEPIAGAGFVDFVPSDTGRVLMLVAKLEREKPTNPPRYYVVSFKDDGTYESAIPLNTSFSPDVDLNRIAVFQNGDLAIAGYTNTKSSVLLFDSSGEFLKQVILHNDLEVGKAVNPPQNPKLAKKTGSKSALLTEDDFKDAMDLSSLHSADDGDVYLARPGSSGAVFQISPGGLVRRIPLQPPDQVSRLVSIKVNSGTIAAEYSTRNPATSQIDSHWITLTDVNNGKPAGTVFYPSSANTGVGMVCFKDGNFVFLTLSPNGYLRLVKAVPQ